MGKRRKRKKIVEEPEDFGTCTLYCKDCDYEFEMDWDIIFDIQECTHGYVGFHLNDVFLSCPKCDEIVTGYSEAEHTPTDNKKPKQNTILDKDDYELPF